MTKTNELIESDREYVKKKVLTEIDKYFDDFKKYNQKLMLIEKQLKTVTYQKIIFARAYSVNIGLILTRKQFNKRYNKTTHKGDK